MLLDAPETPLKSLCNHLKLSLIPLQCVTHFKRSVETMASPPFRFLQNLPAKLRRSDLKFQRTKFPDLKY